MRTYQQPWDVASFLRSPLTVKATDSDEDPDGSAGGVSTDEDTDELNEKDGLDEEAAGKNDEGADADDDEKPKRFASHEAAEEAFVETKSHLSRVEQENQALRRQLVGKKADDTEETRRAVGDEFNEAAMATAIADAVDAEISALPKEKQNLRATTQAIVREVLKSVKPMAEKVADRAAFARSQETMTQEQSRVTATASAEAALKAVGLTKPEHMRLLHGEIADRRATDPQGWQNWVETTKPADQFKELAQGVLKFVRSIGGTTTDAVREANKKHREDADSMDSGTRRVTRPSTKQDADDADGDGGSMLDALKADRAGAFDRSKRVSQFQSVGAGRR